MFKYMMSGPDVITITMIHLGLFLLFYTLVRFQDLGIFLSHVTFILVSSIFLFRQYLLLIFVSSFIFWVGNWICDVISLDGWGWACFLVGCGRKVDPRAGKMHKNRWKQWWCPKEAFRTQELWETHAQRQKPLKKACGNDNESSWKKNLRSFFCKTIPRPTCKNQLPSLLSIFP